MPPPAPVTTTPAPRTASTIDLLRPGSGLFSGRQTNRSVCFGKGSAQHGRGAWGRFTDRLRRGAPGAPPLVPDPARGAGGAQVHVHDRDAFGPARTGIALLVTVRRVRSGFARRADGWTDKLTGSAWGRTAIDAGAGVDEAVAAARRSRPPSGGCAGSTCCTGERGARRRRAPRTGTGGQRWEVNSTTCW
ncbi:hypothetical protein [Streptomyces sp. NPDC017202]|uniref:hypothetical protein n=1 Tax=Streptomyces sp. NPDC017202 TaxID=3364981 RepID=UPI00379E095C